MNKINWTAVAVFAIVALLVFGIAGSLLGGWGYGGWGMMGPGMMGRWGFSPFGWIGMIFMGLIPIGFLVLTVVGIVWLVRTLGSGNTPPAPTKTCPSCGRGVQADWRNCPYCGTALGTQ
jgi:zinc ribbon protein